MKFEILNFKRKGNIYNYLVQGENSWNLKDILPSMQEISQHSTNFELSERMGIGDDIEDMRILDNRRVEHAANITLENTLYDHIKKIKVVDYGIGKQMIDKYIRSITKQN